MLETTAGQLPASLKTGDRYIDRRSRTHDQMVQAARSGVQNIAEGSEAAATSSKIELKLTQVARASLEELKLDYEDFLRQRRLACWDRHHRLRQERVEARLETPDELATWVVQKARQRCAEETANRQRSHPPLHSLHSLHSVYSVHFLP